MNGYICIYGCAQIEVYAETSYKAQLKAQKELKVSDKNRYKISVHLCELSDGSQYVHTPDF